MTIPAGAIRTVIVGHLQDNEVFNTSFWAANNAAETSLDTEAEANQLASDIAGVFTSSGLKAFLLPLISPSCGYDSIKVYSYPTGGPAATVIGQAAIASGVGTGVNRHPLQTAWVASLRTGLSGRSRRGRMYFPQTGAVLSTGHEMDLTNTTNFATNVAAFLTAVNAIPRIARVGVLSQKSGGSFADIVSVTVDSRLDSQRRRANRQAPDFTQSAAVTG